MRAIHSIEDQWLEKVIYAPLKSTLDELVSGTRTDRPDRIDEAIGLLQDALSKISERRSEIDNIERGEAA